MLNTYLLKLSTDIREVVPIAFNFSKPYSTSEYTFKEM